MYDESQGAFALRDEFLVLVGPLSNSFKMCIENAFQLNNTGPSGKLI